MATSTPPSTKVRENRLRRMAERQGLTLHKSRRRDPRALSYGTFWLTENFHGQLVCHHHSLSSHHEIVGVKLDEIEEYLTDEEQRLTDEQRATDAWREYTGTRSD